MNFISKVYVWMSLALLVSAACAMFIYLNPALAFSMIDSNLVAPVFLLELVLVIALSALFNKLSVFLALLFFAAYSILNGLVFGLILFAYSPESVVITFAITAGTFMIMSAYGLVTKQDLTKFGQLAFMGLIGILIASLVNLLIGSSQLNWIITYVGVAVFVTLIAYKSQELKSYALQAQQQEQGGDKLAVYAAFSLYLSFINLFLMLLRIFGRK